MADSRSIRVTYRRLIILALLAAAGATMILVQTRFGPGSSGDSTSYLMGAENILAGRGYARYSGGYEIVPITGFPPGYSGALAILGATGIDLWSAARWLNALLFGVNVFLVGFLVFQFSGYLYAGIVASALVLLYDVQIELHSWIMSEPLYTALMLLTTVVMVLYVRSGRWIPLGIASLLIAAATLTRYVGASLLAGGVLAILLLDRRSVRERLIRAGALVVISSAPVMVWLQRNSAQAETLVNRELSLHAIRPDLIRAYVAEMASWVVPHEVPLQTELRALLAMIILGGILGLFVWMYARTMVQWDPRDLRAIIKSTDDHWHGTIWFLAATGAAYLGILTANSLFLDAATTLAAPPRYLAPFYVVSVVLAVSAAAWLIKQVGFGKSSRLALAVYVLLLGGFYVSICSRLLLDPVGAIGYTGLRYRWAGVRATLESIPEDVPIISNNPELVYALVNRPAYSRPIQFDPYRQEEREDLARQFELTRSRIESGGVLVVFKPIEEIDETVIEVLDLDLLFNYPQANFYGQDQAGSVSRDDQSYPHLSVILS